MGAFPHQIVTGGLLEVSTVLSSYLVGWKIYNVKVTCKIPFIHLKFIKSNLLPW